MPLRVATLNIWNRMGPWDERLASIRHALAALDPDVIGLQEVVQIAGDEPFDQARVIAEGTGYHVVSGLHPDAVHPMGNAILSRWPIRRHRVDPLPQVDTDEFRSLIFAEIDAPFGTLPFFCTHLNWKFHEAHVRAVQIRFVADTIRELADDPVHYPAVLVGDFNAEPDADEIRFVRGLTALGGRGVYFADTFGLVGGGAPGHTYSRTNPFASILREPSRRIDYVFVRGPDDRGRGEPLDAAVCFDAPFNGVVPSDHYGVIATLSTE